MCPCIICIKYHHQIPIPLPLNDEWMTNTHITLDIMAGLHSSSLCCLILLCRVLVYNGRDVEPICQSLENVPAELIIFNIQHITHFMF